MDGQLTVTCGPVFRTLKSSGQSRDNNKVIKISN